MDAQRKVMTPRQWRVELIPLMGQVRVPLDVVQVMSQVLEDMDQLTQALLKDLNTSYQSLGFGDGLCESVEEYVASWQR